MLSLILLAATSAAPAVADVPTVCLETTIAANGRTRKTRIVEGSGDRRDDRGARRYLEVLDFARLPLGVRLGQTGHVIVEVLGPVLCCRCAAPARTTAGCISIPKPTTATSAI